MGQTYWEPHHLLTFRQLRNKYTSAIREAKSDYYLNLIPKSYSNPANFWKPVNALNHKSSMPFPPLAAFNGYYISDHKEIYAAFNDHFASDGNFFDETYTGPPLSAFDPLTYVMAKPCFSLHQFSSDVSANK